VEHSKTMAQVILVKSENRTIKDKQNPGKETPFQVVSLLEQDQQVYDYWLKPDTYPTDWVTDLFAEDGQIMMLQATFGRGRNGKVKLVNLEE